MLNHLVLENITNENYDDIDENARTGKLSANTMVNCFRWFKKYDKSHGSSQQSQLEPIPIPQTEHSKRGSGLLSATGRESDVEPK